MGMQQAMIHSTTALAAVASGSAIYSKIGGSRPDSGITNAVTISAYGGTGTYTFSWVRLSGSSVPAISSTTAASVQWSRTESLNTVNYSATWRCTISDGASSVTVDVSVTMLWDV